MKTTEEFKLGDRVRIVSRLQSVEEAKSGAYYPFFGGLLGTIDKLYVQEAAVRIDINALSEEVRDRHAASEKRMHERWLSGLSEDAKSKLTEEEKKFHLNYSLLVKLADLEMMNDQTPAPVLVEKSFSVPKNEDDEPEEEEKEPASLFEVPARKTSEDLDKAETEFLEKRQQ